MSPKTERIAPSVRFVRSLEGKYYLLREAADLIGISHRTLRKMNNSDDPETSPSFYTYLGKIKIYLYTDDDVERIRKILDTQKTVYPSSVPGPTLHKGRPAKWTAEQRKVRQRKFSQVHYYKNMAERYAQEGKQDKANKALRKMRDIQKQLKDEDREVGNAPVPRRPDDSERNTPSTDQR